MAAAFKLGVEIFVNNSQGNLLRDEACRHRDDITIVMLTTKMSYFGSPTKSTAHIRIFIHSHLHTVSASADNDASAIFTIIDSTANLMCKVWIINTFTAVGTKVFHLKATIGKMLFHHLLQFISGVVTCNRNYFFHKQACL